MEVLYFKAQIEKTKLDDKFFTFNIEKWLL